MATAEYGTWEDEDGVRRDYTKDVYVTIPIVEFERLMGVERAARNLDAHTDEGYATLVSYLIRLHDALDGGHP